MFIARPLSTGSHVTAWRTHSFAPGVKMDSVTAYLDQHLCFYSKLRFVKIQALNPERALEELKRSKDGRERLSADCWEDLTSEASF